jgi:predicted flap endonuclease-1-like 5' DNA nuclease
LSELEAVDLNRSRELEMLREEREHLGGQLRATIEKVSATQYEHGLLRIERDELAAQTQRLTALPRSLAASGTDATDRSAEEARAETGALRESLAERDGLIRQLESKLRERETQASEAGAQLRNWKHRVAPLVLQLRIQRERARKLRALLNQQRESFPAVQPKAPEPAATDDLKEIRGIGRNIERKLRACGIQRFRQLAEMAPGDLESIAAQLAIPASRALRDRWIDQARALHSAKYPDSALFG